MAATNQANRAYGAKNTTICSMLQKALARCWADVQRMVVEHPTCSCDGPYADPVPVYRILCHACNECWRGAEGAQRYRVATSFARCVLQSCPTRSPRRQDLLASSIAIMMVGGLPTAGAYGDDCPPAIKWLLAAYVSLKPIEPFYHELDIDGVVTALEHLHRDPANPTRLAHIGVVPIVTIGRIHTHWQVGHMCVSGPFVGMRPCAVSSWVSKWKVSSPRMAWMLSSSRTPPW